MKILDLDVTYRATILAARHRVPGKVFIKERLQLPIEEIDGFEDPEAFVGTARGEQELRLRGHDGALWAPLRGSLESGPLSLNDFKVIMGAGLGSAFVHPLGRNTGLSEATVGGWYSGKAKQVFSSDRDESIAEVQRGARDLVLVEGRLWRRAKPPHLRIDRIGAGGFWVMPQFQEMPSKVEQKIGVCFAIDEVGVAEAFCEGV